MSYLDQRTQEQQSEILARYLPNDPLWQDKNVKGSILQKILLGLASEWGIFRNKINELYDDYDPRNTVSLIEEWERFVGIPDSCFAKTGSLEERRRNILLKLAGSNASTAKQFENVASILGYNVTVTNGVDASTLPTIFPVLLVSESVAPFLIVVNLDISLKPDSMPLTFPIELTSGIPKLLNCFFNKLKPANTQIFFRYV